MATKHEQVVLYACRFLDAHQITALGALISPPDFSRAWMGSLFDCCLRLADEGGSCADPTAVVALMPDDVYLPDRYITWEAAYVSMPHQDTCANAVWHAKKVREDSAKRRAIDSARRLKAITEEPDSDLKNVLAAAQTISDDLAKAISADRALSPREAVQATYDWLLETMEHKGRHHVWTGMSRVDNLLGGFGGGELVILAARTGVGKSAFAVNIVNHLMKNTPRPVLYVSLEMPAHQVITRFVALGLKKSVSRISRGEITVDEAYLIKNWLEDLGEKPLYMHAPGGGREASPHPDAIRAEAVSIKARHGDLAMIVVDYLQLMEITRKGGGSSRQEEVANISRRLKLLAMDLNVPVLALSQLRRPMQGKESDPPRLSDLRESGAIENDADSVLILHRYNEATEGSNWVAQMDLRIAKNRNGPTSDGIGLLFQAVTGAFAPQPTEGGNTYAA